MACETIGKDTSLIAFSDAEISSLADWELPWVSLWPIPLMILDGINDRVLSANQEALLLFGCDGIYAGTLRFSALLNADLADFLVFLEEAEHKGSAWTRNIALQTLQGHSLECEIRAQTIHTSRSLFSLGFINLNQMSVREKVYETANLQKAGLTMWERAQDFFSELERQNQLILNAAGEGIYGVNAEGKTTFVNRAAQEMLGWSAEDLMGHDIHNTIHHHHLNGESYPAQDCPIYKSFRHEKVNRIEDEVFWCKNGKPIRVEYVSTPVYDQQVLAGAVVIFRDITERKESEKKLYDALQQIEKLKLKLENENAYLQEAISTVRAHHEIIGPSYQTRQLIQQIDLVAPTDANVTISGENGTGKDLVASAIHKESTRSKRVLIQLKCGAVSQENIEAELMGYLAGAFPGALRETAGKLELADNSTLFLEDVTELPLSVQGRLLEVLQEGKLVRMGDNRKRKFDVRVLVSTTRDLAKEVEAGRFREDLYFFLNVFPINCAPLRERPKDIPALVLHSLRLVCRRLNREVPIVTEGTMKALQSYHWPGNVRELQNVVERGAILSTQGKLQIEDVSRNSTNLAQPVGILKESDFEKLKVENLLECLRQAKGRVAGKNGAAELLGVKNTTFYSRMKSYGIDSHSFDTQTDGPELHKRSVL